MRHFEDKEFVKKIDRSGGLLLEEMSFSQCRFDNCHLSLVSNPQVRSHVSRVKLSLCTAINCGIGPAVIEDCTIEALSTNDVLIAWGPILRHVRFLGDCGKVKVNISAHHNIPVSTQSLFDSERDQVYASLDWALDIRDATFSEFDVRGIPARLIRRDPSSQFVITRERALHDGWRARLSTAAEQWRFVIDAFLEDEDDDLVIVAPRRTSKKKARELLRGLLELRELGVLEPD